MLSTADDATGAKFVAPPVALELGISCPGLFQIDPVTIAAAEPGNERIPGKNSVFTEDSASEDDGARTRNLWIDSQTATSYKQRNHKSYVDAFRRLHRGLHQRSEKRSRRVVGDRARRLTRSGCRGAVGIVAQRTCSPCHITRACRRSITTPSIVR